MPESRVNLRDIMNLQKDIYAELTALKIEVAGLKIKVAAISTCISLTIVLIAELASTLLLKG